MSDVARAVERVTTMTLQSGVHWLEQGGGRRVLVLALARLSGGGGV